MIAFTLFGNYDYRQHSLACRLSRCGSGQEPLMRRLIFVGYLCLIGCASGPSAPPLNLESSARIGVIVEASDELTHIYRGFPVQKWQKSYSFDWNLQAAVQSATMNALSDAGFSVIDLASDGMSLSSLSGLMAQQGDFSSATQAGNEAFDRLAERGVSVLVVLEEAEVTAFMLPDLYSNWPVKIPGCGIGTHSFLGWKRHYAVAAFDWKIIVLEKNVDLARFRPIVGMLEMPSREIETFSPDNLEILTESDWIKAREVILDFITEVSTDVAEVLSSS